MKTWQQLIEQEQQKPYLRQTLDFVEQERQAGKVIYPPAAEVFSAFTLTPLNKVKVVILGQDPYHGPNQAHGLSFSVKPGVLIPPSLRNMYKELSTDIAGFIAPKHGYLKEWAEQGVLMLNTVLTVEQGKAHCHAKLGWETFTDKVMHTLNEQGSGIIFLLWGAHAKKKGALLDSQRHHILTAAHPSPLSAYRGFFGCQHFSKTNQLLSQQNQAPIRWQLSLHP
ncbi:uracil-DNA glycosylase [Oceanisphaera avium]|uniref:uracil-DNA glycosylase n=1 Tax=Oceanisphaera avium TaxID=1903694 RepID=UPI0018DF63AD|nr:uracil-DNA glycosylase [Oceanisphaera avium]